MNGEIDALPLHPSSTSVAILFVGQLVYSEELESPIKNHGVIYLRLGYNRARIRLRGWAGIGVNNGQTARKVGHWRKRVANKQREIKVKTDWRVMSEEGGEKGRNKK